MNAQAYRVLAWIRVAAVVASFVAGPALPADLSLTWTDNASDEDGFAIERRLDPPGTWAEIATVGENVTAYTDTTVAAGQGYCYRVLAYNATGDSAYSNVACATASAGDTTPPVLWNGQPTGTLPLGTTTTTLSLTTNEPASCRYAATAGVGFGAMPSAFTTTGGTAHSTPLTGWRPRNVPNTSFFQVTPSRR